MMLPVNYKGITENYDEALILGKFPQCNWTTDMYTAWMTQNGLNSMLSMESDAVSLGTNIASGNLGGGLSSMNSIFNSMYQRHLASKMPPQMKGNINSGDVATSRGENCFHITKKVIREEYARQIDDFFSKYGYKINRIKTPNQTGRANWNFVQIGSEENIGYSTDANRSVPASSMEVINNIYRNGVTIWHDHEKLGDYSLSNNII